MLVFDESNLSTIARVVAALNPSLSDDPAAAVHRMKAAASEAFGGSEKPGYIAYNGFMLTAYHCAAGNPTDLHVKASVADHLFSADILAKIGVR